MDRPIGFDRFLIKPITVYRGEHGKNPKETDLFDAYTFNRKIASKFAGGDGDVIEARIRPIDTYGSMSTYGDGAEIWVPKELVVNRGKTEERQDEWEKYDPTKWAFEKLEADDKTQNDSALDSVIREAEMIKLFAGNADEAGKMILQRCIDSIQKTVLQLTAKHCVNEDSAFFAGELDDDLGEFDVQYPEVRSDEDDEGRWVTTEEKHKIHINEEGQIDKGNPYVLKAIQSGDREGYEKRRSKRRIDKAKAIVDEIDKASLDYRTAKKATQKAHQIARLAERVDDGIKTDLKRLETEGIKKGDKHKLESELEEIKEKLGEVSYRCSADPGYRESHMQEEHDLSARKNQLDFLINCYESAYEDKYALAFPDNKFVSLTDAWKAVQKAEKDEAEAEKRLGEKTKMLSEQSQKAEKQRLYTAGERADAVKEITSSRPFQGLSDAGRQKMSQDRKRVV